MILIQEQEDSEEHSEEHKNPRETLFSLQIKRAKCTNCTEGKKGSKGQTEITHLRQQLSRYIYVVINPRITSYLNFLQNTAYY